ncbi:MAG: penicillin-binding protein [Oscillospiraceae bacterium]|nr:penicillin-binding protein [Oscillospiraceae bacterium]
MAKKPAKSEEPKVNGGGYVIKTKNKKKGTNTSKGKKPAKSKKVMIAKKVAKVVCIILFFTALICGGIAFGIGYQIFAEARENTVDVTIRFQNTIVKDRNGEVIAVLAGDQNREVISLSEMSDYIPKAFVAIEDERFFEHAGVDVRRTAAATMNFVRGDTSFGGSTITQQLIKNITEDDSVTWRRKADEIARAHFLEQVLSKEEILETYLNVIFLGDRAHGVQVASNFYFNKDASEITLAEAAFLAGVAHTPNSYIPFVGVQHTTEENLPRIEERIRTRTITVLAKMLELGDINQAQFDEAREQVIEGLPFYRGAVVQTIFSYHTDGAIMQILAELQEEHGWTQEAAWRYLANGGFTIWTTQDSQMQAQMEEEFRNPAHRRNSRHAGRPQSEASMVIIDHTTGHVLATVGSLGEKDEAFGLNRGTQHIRQTGSAMKTISVLAPGFESGTLTAATVFDDAPFTVGGRTFRNFDHTHVGHITMRDASASSRNIPFLKAIMEVGTYNALQFCLSIGITRLDERDNNIASMALGGLTRGSNTLEMAGAYGMIANGRSIYHTYIIY